MAAVERHLTAGVQPTGDRFIGDELSGLPEPVGRYCRAVIAPGTPLATAAKLRMVGRLKLSGRWLPFRASEILAPQRGFSGGRGLPGSSPAQTRMPISTAPWPGG